MTPEIAAILHGAHLARRRDLRARGIRLRGGSVRVRCWMCGAAAWRRVFTREPVVGRKTPVRVFSRCSHVLRHDWNGRPWVCDGSMHTELERRFVLRAALQYERGGGNRRSEWDG